MPTLTFAPNSVPNHLGGIRQMSEDEIAAEKRRGSNRKYHMIWTPELLAWFEENGMKPPPAKIDWTRLMNPRRFRPQAIRLTFATDNNLVLFKMRWL